MRSQVAELQQNSASLIWGTSQFEVKTLERRNTFYLSIFIVGSVFAVLSYFIDQETAAALTIFYITVALILIFRLYEEWQHYRSHNAPYASAIFIALITPIALGGSYLAGIATLGSLLADLDLRFPLIGILVSLDFIGLGDFSLFLSLFGIIFAFPFFVLLIFLLRKYFSGRYPAIFIFRKRYPRETLIAYSLAIFFLLGIIWLQTRLVELSALIFVITVSFLLFQHYVFQFVVVPIRRVESSARRAGSGRTGSRSARTSGRGSTRSISSNRSSSTTRSSGAPSGSSRSRPLSRSSSGSSRSRPLSRSSSGSSRTRPLSAATRTSSRDRSVSRASRNSTRNGIEVVPAVNHQVVKATSRRMRLSSDVLEKLTPIGQSLTEDNFKCIFCYQFPVESHRKVVICPHCKHPGHLDEWNNWLSVSSICSRCNKPVDQSKLVRVSGENYSKLIKLFKENKLKVKRS